MDEGQLPAVKLLASSVPGFVFTLSSSRVRDGQLNGEVCVRRSTDGGVLASAPIGAEPRFFALDGSGRTLAVVSEDILQPSTGGARRKQSFVNLVKVRFEPSPLPEARR